MKKPACSGPLSYMELELSSADHPGQSNQHNPAIGRERHSKNYQAHHHADSTKVHCVSSACLTCWRSSFGAVLAIRSDLDMFMALTR